MATDLATDGLIDHVDANYVHNVGTCYRCGSTIEPLPLPQFFVKVAPLIKPVLAALKKSEVKIHGAGHDKILNHWLTNLNDWNISRQIVWGIRIPVWYEVDENPTLSLTFIGADKQSHQGTLQELLKNYSLAEIKSGLQQLRADVNAKFVVNSSSPGENYLQETDTFDTWFSSGQWPVTTLKSTNPEDFAHFYPTSVMETGYDILPFWVMRMLLLGMFTTGEVPFRDVYLHGLVRDQKGQKMSKSKGNVINPLEIIEKYGADSLRMALVIRSSPGLDKSVSEPEFKAMRNFTNKIWNGARFVMTMANGEPVAETISANERAQNTANFHAKINQTISEITQQLNDFKIGLAADTVYQEFWHWFCDEAIEQCKQGKLPISELTQGLETFLKLLHPFTPFVSEAVWQELGNAQLRNDQSPWLALAKWPSPTQNKTS
jgi:valyl-tRNA synthetase